MNLPAFIALLLFSIDGNAGISRAEAIMPQPDSIWENQVLYNGRIWRNRHQRVYGHQFLFTADFNSADVWVIGRKFTDVPLKFDIFTDELISKTNKGLIIRLNTEFVDSFSYNYGERRYSFVRIDSASGYRGYVNVIYNGPSTIHVKYRKLIELLAIDRKQDRFYEVKKTYIIRNGKPEQFKGKADFLRLFKDRKHELKEYIRMNGLVVRRSDVFSFVPVAQYYDRLTSGSAQ